MKGKNVENRVRKERRIQTCICIWRKMEMAGHRRARIIFFRADIKSRRLELNLDCCEEVKIRILIYGRASASVK
jgi:hypothetical protein